MQQAEILAAVRGIIDDPDGSFCPAAELSFHLAEAALDFSKRSRLLRSCKASTQTASQARITLPDDCLEIVKLVGADGTELRLMDGAPLPGSVLDDTGKPSHYIRSLDGYNLLRLWPTPTESSALTLYYIAFTRDDQAIPYTYHGSLVWGTAARAAAKSTNPSDQPKIAQFAGAYEKGLRAAGLEASKNFSSKSRVIPYRNF